MITTERPNGRGNGRDSVGPSDKRPLARVALMPGVRRIKPQPTTPSDLPAPIDLLYETTTNFSAYFVPKSPGVDWLNIISLPLSIRTTVKKIRSTAPSLTRPPSFSSLLCCAVTHGLALVLANPHVSALCQMRDHFYHLPQVCTPIEEFIAQYLDSRISSPFPGGTRVNLPIPSSLHDSITSAAESIGCSLSFLGVLSAVSLLSTQDSIPPTYRTEMERQCEQFYALLAAKNSGLEALLEHL